MIERKKGDKWTLEEMIAVAKTYSSRTRLKEGNRHVYNTLKEKKILAEVLPIVVYTKPIKNINKQKAPNKQMGPKKPLIGAEVYNFKWTLEKLKEAAKPYQSRNQFKKGYYNAYAATQKKGLLDLVCEHMNEPIYSKPYAIEELYEVAKNYTCFTTFRKEQRKIWDAANHRGILADLCKNMPNYKKPVMRTNEELSQIAKKYNSREDFRKFDRRAYDVARERKLLPEICKHMICKQMIEKQKAQEKLNKALVIAKSFQSSTELKLHSEKTYKFLKNKSLLTKVYPKPIVPIKEFSLEELQQEALKYNSRDEFYKNSKEHFAFARKNKLLNEICEHMLYNGVSFERYVYSFEFPQSKTAYVGLTYSLNRRYRDHLTTKKSSVYKHIQKTTEKFHFKILTLDPATPEKAAELECFYIEQYKNSGWAMLNQMKGGGIGTMATKWTDELLHSTALKYTNRKDFCKNDFKIYKAALNKKQLKRICSHMAEPVSQQPKQPKQYIRKTYYLIDGKKYNLIKEISIELNLSQTEINKRIKSNKYPNFQVVGNYKKLRKYYTSKKKYKYLVYNKEYSTVAAASKDLNLPAHQISKKINNPEYTDFQRVLN